MIYDILILSFHILICQLSILFILKGCAYMPRKYSNDFKSMIVNLIVNEKHSTIQTANQFNIPLKTLEKWITAHNKDPNIFNSNYLSQSQQIDLLKKKLSQLQRDNDILKKTISLLAKKE